MKLTKILIAASFVLICSFANAQISVPANLQQTFKSAHPMHDFLTWSMENGNYKASSIDENKMHHIVVYDAAGNVLRTEREIHSRDIPTAISGYMNEKYPGEKNLTVWLVEDKDGNKSYYTNMNNENILFDKEGRINTAAAPRQN